MSVLYVRPRVTVNHILDSGMLDSENTSQHTNCYTLCPCASDDNNLLYGQFC
jgi:hypothetical protein